MAWAESELVRSLAPRRLSRVTRFHTAMTVMARATNTTTSTTTPMMFVYGVSRGTSLRSKRSRFLNMRPRPFSSLVRDWVAAR